MKHILKTFAVLGSCLAFNTVLAQDATLTQDMPTASAAPDTAPAPTDQPAAPASTQAAVDCVSPTAKSSNGLGKGKATKAHSSKGSGTATAGMSDALAELVAIQGAQLFKNQPEDHDKFSLIDGAIIFQDVDTDTYTHGFRAVSSQELVADRIRRIYDYPARATPEGISAGIRSRLAHYGYSVLFECTASGCGEANGWRVLYSPLTVGTTANQRYIVAKRVHAKQGDRYLAAYINEADDRPRAVVEYLDMGLSKT